MNAFVKEEQLKAERQKPFAPIEDPYKNLVVPESWNDVQEFADWWMKAGMPIKFPPDAEIFVSDDATFVCLFRQGRFQIELYLIHPRPGVPLHEHPDVEVIKLRTISPAGPVMSDVLKNGQAHGSGMKLEAEHRGFPLIAIQHWLKQDPITLGMSWRGPTVGPLHEALIRRFVPNAYIENGYADTTRTK